MEICLWYSRIPVAHVSHATDEDVNVILTCIRVVMVEIEMTAAYREVFDATYHARGTGHRQLKAAGSAAGRLGQS